MKKYAITTCICFFYLLFSNSTYGQDCKVLYEGIDKIYAGACKKGLAHGKGVGKGTDSYKGNFRKGFPHGRGTYIYAQGGIYEGDWKEGERHGRGTFTDENGSVYSGSWKQGLRHGEGRFHQKPPQKDTIYEGIWEEGEYIGPKLEKPYVVTNRRSIERYTLNKVGDGKGNANRLTIKIMQNGMPNITVTNYRFQWSSGNELTLQQNVRGWEGLIFPFQGSIVYTTENKLRTTTYTVYFDFKINEPGEWELILHN